MYINFTKASHILFFGGFLPLLSLGLAWIFYKIFPNPPFLFVTLSPIYTYTLLYLFFDKYAWSWGIFRILNIVALPDLRGRWGGQQTSSRKERSTNVEIPAYLEIRQTFSKIIVKSYYPKSQSESVVAVFAKLNDELYLFYTYDNEPNSLKSGTMQAHKGTAKLKYLPKENKLRGIYFNSMRNTGDVKFSFEQQDLLYRFKE